MILLSLLQNLFSQKHLTFQMKYFENIALLGERFCKDPNLKDEWKSWIKHFIYINRTFFGLYNLMFDLKSTIKVNDYLRY
jgi:hypothetical protein